MWEFIAMSDVVGIDILYVSERETVTDHNSNLAEIVSWFWASFIHKCAVNTVKILIVPNVHYEKFFMQYSICIYNFCQFAIV